MTRIVREPIRAANEDYDIVIVGGGIYGAMLLLVATAHDLKAILIERNDFGSQTSFNSLRIIHGGLRYLQSLDIPRSKAMIAERAWFLKNFPDLIFHLPCLMPIYNRGLRSKSMLRFALRLDNLLSSNANQSLPKGRRIPASGLIPPSQVERLFPMVDRLGLKAGAIWHDACVPDSQRLIMELLRWSVSMGSRALNYVEAGKLLKDGTNVRGVLGHDKVTDEYFDLRARVVINATGPSSRSLAARYDRDIPELFRPSLAWNVLFDRPRISDHAVAVSNADRGAHTYFLLPWKGKLLVGTGHGPVTNEFDKVVTAEQLHHMIEDVNRAVAGLSLQIGEVARVFLGLLPVRHDGTIDLTTREAIHDHGRHGCPQGLFTVSGTKLVAAHRVAVKTIRAECSRFFPNQLKAFGPLKSRPDPAKNWDIDASSLFTVDACKQNETGLKRIIEEESVIHLGDLAIRRTTLWEEPVALMKIAKQLALLFDWHDSKQRQEIARLEADLYGTTMEKGNAGD